MPGDPGTTVGSSIRRRLGIETPKVGQLAEVTEEIIPDGVGEVLIAGVKRKAKMSDPLLSARVGEKVAVAAVPEGAGVLLVSRVDG